MGESKSMVIDMEMTEDQESATMEEVPAETKIKQNHRGQPGKSNIKVTNITNEEVLMDQMYYWLILRIDISILLDNKICIYSL
jgi:hypothetical protein